MVVGEGRKFIGALFTIKSKVDHYTGEGEDKLPDLPLAALRKEGIIKDNESPPTPSSMVTDPKILKYIESKV